MKMTRVWLIQEERVMPRKPGLQIFSTSYEQSDRPQNAVHEPEQVQK